MLKIKNIGQITTAINPIINIKKEVLIENLKIPIDIKFDMSSIPNDKIELIYSCLAKIYNI